MKKTVLFIAIALFLGSMSMNAQTDPVVTSEATVVANTSLSSKFLPMPEPLTMEKIFPTIGNYQSTQTNIEGATAVTIVLDPENKGLVWIEGLPQGKIKAMLRVSPATYKIPAQKTEEGKDVPEGTLVYDKDANVLNICLGCKYNDVEPLKPFASTEMEMTTDATVKVNKKSKVTKAKVWRYTGTKDQPIPAEKSMNPIENNNQ